MYPTPQIHIKIKTHIEKQTPTETISLFAFGLELCFTILRAYENSAIELAEYYGVSLDYLAGRTNFKQGRANPDFSDEQLQLAEQYARLTEKNKGRLELYLEQLLAKQDK